MLRRYQELVTGVPQISSSSSSSDIEVIDDIDIQDTKVEPLSQKKKSRSDLSAKQRVAKLLDKNSAIHQIFKSTDEPDEPKTSFLTRIEHDPIFDEISDNGESDSSHLLSVT